MSAPFLIRPDTNQVCKKDHVLALSAACLYPHGAAVTTHTTARRAFTRTARLYSTQDLFLSTFVPGDSNLWHKAEAG